MKTVKMVSARFGGHEANVRVDDVAQWEAAGWQQVKEPKGEKVKGNKE